MEHTSIQTEQQTEASQEFTRLAGYSRADLHMHTNLGDGWASPAKVIEVSMARGLGLIAVTDHDHVEGAKRIHPARVARQSRWQAHNLHTQTAPIPVRGCCL